MIDIMLLFSNMTGTNSNTQLPINHNSKENSRTDGHKMLCVVWTSMEQCSAKTYQTLLDKNWLLLVVGGWVLNHSSQTFQNVTGCAVPAEMEWAELLAAASIDYGAVFWRLIHKFKKTTYILLYSFILYYITLYYYIKLYNIYIIYKLKNIYTSTNGNGTMTQKMHSP